MKLAELKAAATGAFTVDFKKMADNLSLGDVKDALRASKTAKFDAKLVKALSFASSFRRSNADATAKTMSCTLELPTGLKMDIAFAMLNGEPIVTSLTATPDDTAAEENDATE
jgi:hypothetical protein